MKTKDESKKRPANKATADQPAEEFIAPQGAHAEREDEDERKWKQEEEAGKWV